MSAKPLTIDEYLALLSHEKRAALEKLRRAIRSAAPKGEECIPTLRPRAWGEGLMVLNHWLQMSIIIPETNNPIWRVYEEEP
jgi:hypothetical protein